MAMGAGGALATQLLGSAAKSKEQGAFTPETAANFDKPQPHAAAPLLAQQMMHQPRNPYAEEAAGMQLGHLTNASQQQPSQSAQPAQPTPMDHFQDMLKKIFGGAQ